MSDIPDYLTDPNVWVLPPSDIPETLTDRVLVQRALDAQRPKNGHTPRPRWALAKDLFSVGSTVAIAICYKYGFDPNKEVHPLSTIPDRPED